MTHTSAPPPHTTTRAALRFLLSLASVSLAVLLLIVLFARVGYAQDPAPAPTPAGTEVTSEPGAIDASSAVTASASLTATAAVSASTLLTSPIVHAVKAGESLSSIARKYGVTVRSITQANSIRNPDLLRVGQPLVIPGTTAAGEAAPAAVEAAPVAGDEPALSASPLTQTLPSTDTNLLLRMTTAGRTAPFTSPFYRSTWLTYYGRPKVPVMGILGEHDLETLTRLLKEQAAVYDVTNGGLKVKPAFHLVHGMATVIPTPEKDYLEYLPDEKVMEYINAGLEENIAVILDIQIGALSVTDAISPALKYLKYPNVHLAIDPEFDISYAGQTVPGNPIGYVTGNEINAAQELIAGYLEEHGIRGRRILLVHQFFEEMIRDKESILWDNPRVELTFCADGWGDAGNKIWKYNRFFSNREDVKYTCFKLFNRWDTPVLSEAQAMGVEPWSSKLSVEVPPNMIIYQ